jgi:hypothetical protein
LRTILRDGAAIGGDLARRASTNRRIRKLSLGNTLSGRPELHCEAHVSDPAPRSLWWDRTPGQGVGVQIYLSCRVSAFRLTCRVA